ncbi:MAG: anti-sigma factor [Phormidesmis sp.]
MSPSTPSDRTLFLVSGYVLGTLEASESVEFAQLVAEDSTVLREVDQMQQALEKAYSIVERDPPPQLRERVLTAASLLTPDTIDLSSSLEPMPEDWSLRSPSIMQSALQSVVRSAVRSLWVAAAVAIAALGLSNYGLWRQIRQQVAANPDPSALELPTLNPIVYTLKSTTTAKAAAAKITLYPETLTAQLDISGLPPLPPEQVYVLWTVLEPKAPFTTDDKGAVLATTFEVNAQGNASEAIAVPIAFQQPQTVAALGVTIESANAPQSHTGEPILLAKLL